jgi:SAM-dependent methyltransferase
MSGSARWVLVQAAHMLSRPLQALPTMLAAAAAGAVRRQELQAAIGQMWDEIAGLEGTDRLGWHAWESEFYGSHLSPAGRVLLVGCGTGRDLVPLIERGHQAVGLDLSAAALEVARRRLAQRGLAAELRVGPVEDASLPADLDFAVFSWLCYGYLVGSEARVRALQRLRECLRPGGRVLVTYPLRAQPSSRWPARMARLTARLLRSDWCPEHGDLFLLSRGGARLELHYEHRFVPEEFLGEARRAGLTPSVHEVRGIGLAVLKPMAEG